MTVKSIVDIDVRDERFRAFVAQYDRYSKLLTKSPEQWSKVFMQISRSTKTFDTMVHKIVAAKAQAALLAAAQKKADDITRTTADRWRDIARSTRDVASNVRAITGQIVRWASLGTVIGGLLGVGGLFGLDRLANTVAAGRRQTTGVDVGYGEKKSFETNYGRIVDADSFLTNVSSVLRDVTRRHAVYGAGLDEGQIAGKNSAQVGELLIPALKRLADQTPTEHLAQVLQARGLDQFIGLQEFQRLKGTSPSELAQIQKQYGQDVRSFDLSGSTQKAWQDFAVQMTRAGEKIENVFVKGLEPLAPALTKLSDSFADTVKTFLSNTNLEKWIKGFGDGIEKAATYIGTDKFQEDIKTFVDGIAKLASVIGRVASFVGGAKDKIGYVNHPRDWIQKDSFLHKLFAAQPSSSNDRHNPGNLRIPGQSTGFASFGSDEEGIRAMARQLKLYQRRDKLDTIQGIVSKYAPATENDVASYVGNVSKRTGFGPNQKLDLNDSAQLAALISAMTKQENSKSNFTAKTVVEIINSTGGNAVVTANQVAQ